MNVEIVIILFTSCQKKKKSSCLCDLLALLLFVIAVGHPAILVGLGCYNRISYTWWLKLQTCISHSSGARQV